jgi:RNA polymerase sigma-70 factor (ECF subfamily)
MKSEESLIREIKQNRNGALAVLYDRYAPAFLGICLRYCGNRQDAEDVLQDGFIKIIKHLHSFTFRSSSSFECWMKRIIVNTALNFLRDRSKENRFADIDHFRDRIPDQADEPDLWKELDDQITKEQILEMICEMPSGYRTVFNLYVFEEYSHREIASQLQVSENTSKSQLLKARIFLRKKINEVMVNQKVES